MNPARCCDWSQLAKLQHFQIHSLKLSYAILQMHADIIIVKL